MTAITYKKLRDKLMQEKTAEMKKTIEMINQITYEKKNNKNTIPEAFLSNQEKGKRRTDPKKGQNRSKI